MSTLGRTGMSTLERLLEEWRDPLSANTFSDAEDLIHMLMVELAGKEAIIESLEADIQYYKSVGKLLTVKLESPRIREETGA